MTQSCSKILLSFLIVGATALPAAAGKHKSDDHGTGQPHDPRPPHPASSAHSPTSGPNPHGQCCEEVDRLRREIERLRSELERCDHRR